MSLSIELHQGDAYLAADGRRLVWSVEGAPDLAGATITLVIARNGTAVVTATGALTTAGFATDEPQVVSIPITEAQSSDLVARAYRYRVVAELANDSTVTLAEGHVTAVPRLA